MPIRTPAEYPIRLHEMDLRFCLARDVTPLCTVAGMEACERRLSALAHRELGTGTNGPNGANGANEPERSNVSSTIYSPAYFATYREALCSMLRFQVHETHDDPLMCLFVLHTDSIPGYAWKEELQRLEDGLSSKVKACLAAGTAVRHVVFVGDLETHEEGLRGIENTLKASNRYKLPCMLYFEHRTSEARDQSRDPNEKFDSIPRTASSVITRGMDVASFLEIVSSLCLLPHIESQIRDLEVIISASRRGLKNQLKTFLFRRTPSDSSISPKEAGDGTGQHAPELSATYSPLRRGGIEAAMRQQSDLLMLVGDFGTAVATLKLLSSDLKSDKLHFHYAASQEALAMATLASGGSISVSIMYLKDAFLQYAGLVESEKGLSRSLAAVYCTRVALQWTSLLEALNRLSEASWILMRAHFHESNMRAAFLLEYSAYFLIKQRPAKLRKYGFYLVLAALRYGQSQENSLAFIAHQTAIGVLQGKGWDILEEHVHEALDHEWTALGDDSKAFEHAVAMLHCFNLPSHLQSSHMAHMIDVHGKVEAKHSGSMSVKSAVSMGVPVLDTAHTAVLCAGSHDYYDEASRNTPNRVWKDMELDFPRTMSWSKASKALQKSKPVHGRHKSDMPGQGRACVGEDIVIKIPVSNPLKIALELLDVELLCETLADDNLDDADNTDDPDTVAKVSTRISQSKSRMILGPGEEDVLELTCRARQPGSISIHGVRWNLSGVPCKVEFAPQVSKWSLDRELRPARGGPIDIDIMPPMPRLHVELNTSTPCPEQMLVGEIVQCKLTLSNIGATDLHNIQCVASRNVFLDNTEQCGEVESCRWYKDMSISVGETRTVDMYVRAEHAGHQDVRIVWRYQAKTDSASTRFLRFSRSIYAEPSLLEAQVLIIDHAAEDETDMMCMQARATPYHPIQLDSLIISLRADTRAFDLRGISALPSSAGGRDASPSSPASPASPTSAVGSPRPANFEFDHRIEAGRGSDGLDGELSAAEYHFVRCSVHSSSSGDTTAVESKTSPTKSNYILRNKVGPSRSECGILRWTHSHETTNSGLTIFPLTKSSDAQAGNHGVCIAQLAAPTSLQHNFAEGPLTINLELEVHSKMDDTVDITWIIGNSSSSASSVSSISSASVPKGIAWVSERCGIQVDVRPGEKRFIILEALATHAGTLKLDPIYLEWHARKDACVTGSLTLPPNRLNVMNVRPRGPE